MPSPIPPPSHRLIQLAVRLVMLLVTEAGFILLLKSHILSVVVGRPLAGRLHYGPDPGLFVFLLCVLFVAYHVATGREITWRTPSRMAQLCALGAALLVACAGGLLSYPPPAVARLFEGYAGANVATMMAALRYSVILALMVPVAVLLFPLAFLRANAILLVVGGAGVIAYLWLAAARIMLHAPLARFTLRWSLAMLRMVDAHATSDNVLLTVTDGSFTAFVGPECLGLDGLVLFLCVWSVLWFAASRTRRGFSRRRAAAGLVAGLALLYVLNLMRIAAIVFIGARLPAAGVEFFHGLAGVAMFLLVLTLLLPCLRARD